jgi:polar amino acid transport system substrate-binding protein
MSVSWIFSIGAYAEPLRYYVVDANAAPFQITENGASTGGIITKIVEALAPKLDAPLKTHVAVSKRIENLLSREQNYDWITYHAKVWNALSKGEIIDEPLFYVRHALMHCNPELKAPVDLSQMHIAIINGFRYPELSAMELDGKLSLLETRDYSQAIELIGLGRVNGFVEMGIRLEYQLQQLDNKKDCLSLSDISHIIPPYAIYIAVNASMDEAIKTKIKTELQLMRSNGSIEKIWSQYSDSAYYNEQ